MVRRVAVVSLVNGTWKGIVHEFAERAQVLAKLAELSEDQVLIDSLYLDVTSVKQAKEFFN